MKHEINPHDTSRLKAFELWMDSPMPMVTLTKTLDVSGMRKLSRQMNISFNMLLCWSICLAASRIEEFFILPEQGKLFKFDRLAINVIVKDNSGGICSCDIPFTDDLERFKTDYDIFTTAAASSGSSSFSDGAMVIGTSAMVETELDSIVNQYTDKFCNPMVMWGKYRRCWFKTELPVSFQFHHVQMDGGHAARFLGLLQKVIDKF